MRNPSDRCTLTLFIIKIVRLLIATAIKLTIKSFNNNTLARRPHHTRRKTEVFLITPIKFRNRMNMCITYHFVHTHPCPDGIVDFKSVYAGKP